MINNTFPMINPDPLGRRRERKVKAAQGECEVACREAEDVLMKALDLGSP